jgi:hypothetical protein
VDGLGRREQLPVRQYRGAGEGRERGRLRRRARGRHTHDAGGGASTSRGRAYLYLGSAAGLAARPAWTASGDDNNGAFGFPSPARATSWGRLRGRRRRRVHARRQRRCRRRPGEPTCISDRPPDSRRVRLGRVGR